ncbi:hypothetical protein MTO96_039032 [Rhipicephalus appendiculatus]
MILDRNAMGGLHADEEEPPLATVAERVDIYKIFDREGAEHFRRRCAAATATAVDNNQVCPIKDYLRICNELLFNVGMELREQRGGSLSLVCFKPGTADVPPPACAEIHRSNTFLPWLLRTHVCIDGLEVKYKSVTAHSRLFLEELPENCRLRKLRVEFPFGDTVQIHFASLLPRLRCLEELYFLCLRPQTHFWTPYRIF